MDPVKRAREFNQRGLAAMDCGQFDAAAEFFRNATVAVPHAAGAHNNLGFALFQLGRYQDDTRRTIPLSQWLQHLPEGLQFVSLQRDVRASDRPALEGHPRILDFSAELRDFSDTAALCECLDLVISVDTSAAHLSGSLGRRTWLLLPFHPDWRWLLGREDSPWYPTFKLYRQPAPGDWNAVFRSVSEDLLRVLL
jgi:hypothetical protein